MRLASRERFWRSASLRTNNLDLVAAEAEAGAAVVGPTASLEARKLPTLEKDEKKRAECREKDDRRKGEQATQSRARETHYQRERRRN